MRDSIRPTQPHTVPRVEDTRGAPGRPSVPDEDVGEANQQQQQQQQNAIDLFTEIRTGFGIIRILSFNGIDRDLIQIEK